MITLSLDEYGDFEGLEKKHQPVFIGGVLYDDADEDGEQYRESCRIRGYYQMAVAEAAKDAEDPGEIRYPEALHSDGNKGRNHNIVRQVKEVIRDTLPEFLKSGTFRGQRIAYSDRNGHRRTLPDRKGRYYVFIILKSAAGMSELLSSKANILAKDDYGSNLYFHMADILVTRLVFYNPRIRKIDNFAFYLATRVSPDLAEDSPIVDEYKKQGYRALPSKKTRNEGSDETRYVYFQLTNPDIYRTVIAEEILDAGRPDITISRFLVNSINYEEHAYNMEYLYLADTVCSFLQFKLPGVKEDEWLNALKSRTEGLIGKPGSLIFGYDGIDSFFAKAWAKYEEGDLYEALSRSFDAGKKKGAFAKHYKEVWFKTLEERILESDDVAAFNIAVQKLKAMLNHNAQDQEKALYILKILEKMAPGVIEKFNTPEANRILYELYDCGVASYCHVGDSRNAEKYFKKCGEYAGYVGLEDYLYTRNRMVVFCCDYFELERAEKISDENIVYQELLTDLKKDLKIPGIREAGYTAMGIARSQRAQVYAFLRDERAEEEFRAALEDLEKGSANYKITQSFLLHYYLDSGNREAWIPEAEDYFGGQRKLNDQLEYILREGSKQDPVINMKYALYVFVKGLYLFRAGEITDRVWKNLQGAEEKFAKKIRKKGWTLTGHPSELIFKYLRLIAISRGETEPEQQYAERMAGCLLYSGCTEEVILKFGETEIAEIKRDRERRDLLSAELFDCMSKEFPAFEKLEKPDDGDARYRWLDEHITFMYR